MQMCGLENVVFVLIMSRCSYLNYTVVTYSVHNSGMILLKPLWKKLCVGYNNSLRRLMKLDKHSSASEAFVHYGYLPLVNYKGNILQILSIGFGLVQIVLLWVLFYLLFRCLLLSGATGLILYTLANYILWSVYPLF